MNWRPKQELTEDEIRTGMRLAIGDGLASEAMTSLTAGTFLVAFALLLGASNFEIGLLAALPTLTNIFQLVSIWLVQRTNNRRVISVLSSFCARIPLVIIGALPFFFPNMSIQPVIIFLFFYYLFASVAGLSWNAWMKDLIPEKLLGSYFSRRQSYMTIVNVCVSLTMAVFVDYIKNTHPEWQLSVYSGMYIAGGVIGIIGAIVLSKVPEPASMLMRDNIIKLFMRPLRDGNFRRLLVFNSAWVFAVNIATPFFAVFMMKTLGLSLSYIIGLTILGQVFSILTVRIWGQFSDKYSNKTIIAIGAPLFILVMIGWCFVGIYSRFGANLALLVVLHIVSGIATAGINLSLINIGLKLAPKNEAIVYLSAKNIVTAVFSSLAPLLGGYLADYFSHRSLVVNVEWTGPRINKVLHLVSLHEWNFLFLIAAVVAFIAAEFLLAVKETGEVDKDEVIKVMRKTIRNNLKETFFIGTLVTWQENVWGFVRRRMHWEKDHHPEDQPKPEEPEDQPIRTDQPQQ